MNLRVSTSREDHRNIIEIGKNQRHERSKRAHKAAIQDASIFARACRDSLTRKLKEKCENVMRDELV